MTLSESLLAALFVMIVVFVVLVILLILVSMFTKVIAWISGGKRSTAANTERG